MHFSWATGGKWATIFIPGTLHYRSATFLFPFSRGNVLATTSCDRPGMRRTETSERSCFNASTAVWRRGRGSGYPHPSYMKALSFSIYWPATAAWNKTGFFSKRKEYMILSLIFLYLSEPVIENRATRRLQAVGLGCWPGKTYRVCKCLLIIFSCFFYCGYIYDEQYHLTISKGNRAVTVPVTQCKHFPTDVDNDTEGLSPAG